MIFLPQTAATPSAATQAFATQVADKPLTGAERAQVVQQTADGISAVRPQVMATGHGQMTVQMHPQEWGDLRVTVQLAPATPVEGVKQTAVVAHVVASTPAIKAALETQSADLTRALRQTGMQLERLTVTVQAPTATAQSGFSLGGGHSSGGNSQDQWQATQFQTNVGTGGPGEGGSSSFASFSERQGGGNSQNPSASRTALTVTEESGTDVRPVPSTRTGQYAGFDQRV